MSIIEPSDDELMRRYSKGDAGAFDVLYARHKDAVYRYCSRQLPVAIAAEAHQETWMALIKARKQYEPRKRFASWLFTLAHNAVLNRIRAEMKHPHDPDVEAVAADADPEATASQGHLATILLALIAALPHHQRDALLLQQEGGFSIEEIAAITNTSKEGVKSRLRYAMDKLRQQMADYQVAES